MATIRKNTNELKGFKFSSTQKARIEAMSEEDIERYAREDDAIVISSDEDLSLAVIARALRKIRKQLELTQEQFSEMFEIPLPTVRDWEQARRMPEKPSRSYLKAIFNDPKAVQKALHKAA